MTILLEMKQTIFFLDTPEMTRSTGGEGATICWAAKEMII